MCAPKAPKQVNPAQPAPPAAEGADSLVLGGSKDDEFFGRAGLVGRTLLRIGKSKAAGKGGSSGSTLQANSPSSNVGMPSGSSSSMAALRIGAGSAGGSSSSGGGGGGRGSARGSDSV